MILSETKWRDTIGNFVANQLRPGEYVPWGEFSALGLVTGGTLVAGVIYNHYSPPNICVSVAARKGPWITPEFLFCAFDYPFNALELARVTGFISEANTTSLSFAERLGFRREGCLRKALPDGASQIIVGMLKEECPWISDDFSMRLAKRFKLRGKVISHA